MAKGKYEKWLTADGLLLLEAWARDGLTDEQIAMKCGISAGRLYEWKKTYREIDEALKRGKEVVDTEVENALLKRALGYEYTEQRVELSKDGKKVVQTIKQVAPDVAAQFIWLKNRKPGTWRDKPVDEGDGETLKKAKDILGGVDSVVD